jgi:hypothetical protein
MNYFASFFFFLTGLIILVNKSYQARWSTQNVDLSQHYLYFIIGTILMLYGIAIVFYSIKKKPKPKHPPYLQMPQL